MPPRVIAVVKCAALGVVSALLLIVGAFFVGVAVPSVARVIWAPGAFLVAVSNAICPPFGVECFLGSQRQGAHHLWFFICLLLAWASLLSVAWWGGLSLTARRTRTRA